MFEDIPILADLGDVRGRSVLVRADLNVPLRKHQHIEGPLATSEGGPMEVADDFRIRSALPTLRWLVDRGAQVTVASHLGRPGGKPRADLAMAPVRACLDRLVPGLTVLENLRFDPGEEANDHDFGAKLVAGHDAYVNDAFGACHRAHASIVYPPSVLPSAGGLLLHQELQALAKILVSPPRPFTVVVGGAKVADKLATVRALAASADRLLIGGAMAFTFMAARGAQIGRSPVDEAAVEACGELLRSDAGARIELPEDLLVVPAEHASTTEALEPRVVIGDVPAGWQAFDIGYATRAHYASLIRTSAAVLWNGPMGRFEDARFGGGTQVVAKAVASSRGFSVVGGGDTVAAVRQLDLSGHIDHLSSGGGAMLELIERRDLPGIAALREAGARQEIPGSRPDDHGLRRSDAPWPRDREAGGPGETLRSANPGASRHTGAYPAPRAAAATAPKAGRDISTLLVDDIELEPALSISHDATVRQTATAMEDRHRGYALVGASPPWLVTEHDLVGALASGADPDGSIDQVATRTPLWATTGSTVLDAIDMMLRHHVRHLLVTSPQGRPCGVLSISDAVGVLLSDQ